MLCLFVFSSCAEEDPGALDEDPIEDEEVLDEGLTDNNQLAETIMATIVDTPNLNTFAELLQEADLADVLGETEGGPYTVFAPTDEAFNTLQPITIDWLLMDEHMDRLTDMLGYHIVDDVLEPEDIGEEGALYGTLYEDYDVEAMIVDDGTYIVNGINVMNIMQASNGTIYVIGEVLIPDDWVDFDEWDEIDY